MAVPLNIAHRGGAGLMPENTLAAFADAIARGCAPGDGAPPPLMEYGAELDVQLSADGIAVVHHDFRLMADVARKDGAWLDAAGPRIKDLPLADLQGFDIGRVRPGSEYARAHPALCAVDGQTIPTLEAVVTLAAAAPGRFLLMVELKCDSSDDSADPLALAEAAYAICGNDVIYVGFDPGPAQPEKKPVPVKKKAKPVAKKKPAAAPVARMKPKAAPKGAAPPQADNAWPAPKPQTDTAWPAAPPPANNNVWPSAPPPK